MSFRLEIELQETKNMGKGVDTGNQSSELLMMSGISQALKRSSKLGSKMNVSE